MDYAEVADSAGLQDVEQAAERLKGVARHTPLIASEYFSVLSGNEVRLKAENLQHTGAFKRSGA